MQPDIRLPDTPAAPAATQDAGLPIRADLRGTTAYGAPQADVPIRLNTNENPYPPPAAFATELAEVMRAAAAGLNRYPDRDATALRAELAGYLTAATGVEVTTAQVWAANGSNEVIQQLLQVFGGPGRTALGFAPSYSMHPRIAAATGTGWIDAARDASFGLDAARAVAAVRAHRPDVVFLTSPNNPTGTALSRDAVAAVADAAPGMVVVDEAYAEFARPGTASAVTLLPGRPRLVVTRTMSKAFALAGGRVGYLAADPAVREALLLVRLPYHLSTQTQLAARTALAHRGALLAAVGRLRDERDAVVDWLRRSGYAVADSDANFVLFGEFAGRTAIWRGLLARGVLVREVGPPAWLRVSVGTPAEMAAFRSALTEVAGTAGAEPEEER